MTHSELSAEMAETDAWISACLRKESADGLRHPPLDTAALISRVAYHGVAGLLAEDAALMARLPDEVAQGIQDVARGHAFWELAHRRLLTRLAPDLAAAGIAPLILKGTALAYSVYDKPALRPRGDTDVVVAEADYTRTQQILKAHGFSLAFAPGGQIVSSQCSYERHDGHGLHHVIDLHRQTNNHAALAGVFPYAELRARAEPLDRLAPLLLRPGLVDAMLFACYHRFMHIAKPITVTGTSHLSENRLIWLLDMVRIARFLSDNDWETLVVRAREKGLLRICHGSLVAARDWAGLDLPAPVLQALEAAPPDEPPVRFLRAGRAGRLMANLAATPGTGQRLGFLWETAFPPAAYMREAFGHAGRPEPLPKLYLRRALRGVAALTRKGSTDL